MVQIGKGWSQVAVQAEPHSFHTLPLVQVVGGVAVIVKSVAMAKRRIRRNIVVVELAAPIDLLLYEYNCCWTARIRTVQQQYTLLLYEYRSVAVHTRCSIVSLLLGGLCC